MELTAKFKALSDNTRLRIVGLLLVEQLCVCEVVEILEMTQSRISRHMGILKQAGLVAEERAGKWVIYRLRNRENPFLACLRRGVEKEPEVLADRKRLQRVRAAKSGPPRCGKERAEK